MTKQAAIVTRETLIALLANERTREQTIGRALVALFNRQTASEQNTNDTKEHNTVGFAGCDAKSGSISAKFFLKNKTLQQFVIDRWTKETKGGYPYLCKYARQLNEIAIEKQAQRTHQLKTA